jgi:hypothetical protein
MHITKNYLADQGAISSKVKVPLVMGIWGPKGCGKTFQVCVCVCGLEGGGGGGERGEREGGPFGGKKKRGEKHSRCWVFVLDVAL